MTVIDIKTKLLAEKECRDEESDEVVDVIDFVQEVYDHVDSYLRDHNDNTIWIQGTVPIDWDITDVKCDKCSKRITRTCVSWFTNALSDQARKYVCGIGCLGDDAVRRVYKAAFINKVSSRDVEHFIHKSRYLTSFLNDDFLLEAMLALYTQLEPDDTEAGIIDAMFENITTARDELNKVATRMLRDTIDKYYDGNQHRRNNTTYDKSKHSYSGHRNEMDFYDGYADGWRVGHGGHDHHNHKTVECPVCKATLCERQYECRGHENILEHAANTGHVTVLGDVELVDKITEVVCS